MRQLGRALGIEHRAEHVRDVREGDHLVVGRQQSLGGVEIDPAVVGERADVDLPAGELPRDDVRVVLELATAARGPCRASCTRRG
jgi:hypothetical protein